MLVWKYVCEHVHNVCVWLSFRAAGLELSRSCSTICFSGLYGELGRWYHVLSKVYSREWSMIEVVMDVQGSVNIQKHRTQALHLA